MTSTRAIVGVCAFVFASSGCGGGDAPMLIMNDAARPMPDMGATPMDAARPDAWTPPPVDAGPTCMGAPASCASATDMTSCTAIQGCAFGACAGAPPDCHRLVMMTTCAAVEGCVWNGICRGTARACGTYADMTGCATQMSCAWGTTSVCSGTSAPCSTFTAAQCLAQPGCSFTPPDAWVAPPDAWVPPPDANCTTGGSTTTIALHTITPDLTLGGVHDLAAVHVHAESACGTDMQLVTDASGALSLVLPDSGAPWDVTLAKAGYAAVSLIDITHMGFAGDVRLDPLMIGGATTMYATSGSVTGTIGAGSTLQIDNYDFDTMTANAAHAFSSHFYVGYEQPAPPLRFVALELSGSGSALNLGSAAPIARPSGPVTGVTIAMPSPAAASMLNHVTIHLPTTGITSPPHATSFGAEHALLDTSNFPFVLTGSAIVTAVGGDPSNLDLAITHFPGALDVNVTGITNATGSAILNVLVTDLSDHTITVPPVTVLTSAGTSFADLSVFGAGVGYDVLILHLGESTTERPHWRVFADARSGTGTIDRLPHLPSGVTIGDIGLSAATTSYLPLYVHMQTGRAWTTEALNRAVPQYAWSVGTTYQTISTAGR